MHLWRTGRVLAAAVAVPLIAGGVLAGTASAAPAPVLAPLVSPAAEKNVVPIAGSYLVQTKRGSDARGLSRAAGVTPSHVWTDAVHGFAAKLDDKQLAQLRRDPNVVLIEQDVWVHDMIDATQSPVPTWGVDRVDQVNLPLSNTYTYTYTGAGVHAYIIDTGIVPSHPDFGGRASFDFNAIDSNNTDCQGHGTHVAGTIGSNTYGVAKGVRLHGVKMMNCAGSATTTSAVNAINWVRTNAQRPAVANTSWNFTASSTLETAIRNMISSGVFLATSAGNTGGNSCDRLPRKVETASVVASSERTDARSSFSSTGSCVDLYAPGGSILSTSYTGGTATMSGTSMATPHVAGVAALYKHRYGDQSSATVHNWINANATPNKVSGGTTGGTVNRLLYKTTLL